MHGGVLLPQRQRACSRVMYQQLEQERFSRSAAAPPQSPADRALANAGERHENIAAICFRSLRACPQKDAAGSGGKVCNVQLDQKFRGHLPPTPRIFPIDGKRSTRLHSSRATACA